MVIGAVEEDDGAFPFPFAAAVPSSGQSSSSATPKTGMQASAGGKYFHGNGTGSFFFTGDDVAASFPPPAFARDAAASPAPEAIALET
jgi:hypothetical protein